MAPLNKPFAALLPMQRRQIRPTIQIRHIYYFMSRSMMSFTFRALKINFLHQIGERITMM